MGKILLGCILFASAALSAGTKRLFIPSRSAASAIDSAPGTARSSPASESSPKNAQSAGSFLICPSAESMPSSTGRSYTVPAFFTSAGARFTVIRLTGNLKPMFFIAARTRSRASLTAASRSPTISKPGRPLDIFTSTVTPYPPIPLTPKLLILENTASTP